ncbi:MAG TPA: DUF2630 family protein [Candidatus Polarisedimenticolaceae bacterium]|nr:DUF2630 family protein [Candidatus Polarisedimenticolaceae bacterium]
MANEGSDRTVRHHIEDLVKEEHHLRDHKTASDADKKRLAAIEVELDQCWDLLRQRRALREFGDDPDRARVRPADVVEKYEQ